ncbi:hypothetical protein CDL15_Pgr021212 [Punica granatum]|uniref:Uncharacterized protein n=1 Tax=Punica granatum TaxID=22663 RepID=A0A218WX43_PUNGR|nr:hypothetical protein CDL15_Pgr021212 [Punica granatum]
MRNPVREKRTKRRLCTVGRPSDRDHLFTEEGEGCEEPFERDGTTRRSREVKWHVVGGLARMFDDILLKSGRVVTGIPGGVLTILAGFGLGKGLDGTWKWAGRGSLREVGLRESESEEVIKLNGARAYKGELNDSIRGAKCSLEANRGLPNSSRRD